MAVDNLLTQSSSVTVAMEIRPEEITGILFYNSAGTDQICEFSPCCKRVEFCLKPIGSSNNSITINLVIISQFKDPMPFYYKN